MNSAEYFTIGGNDEHGLNPPTAGKRTPVMPYLGRPFYENEINRMCKEYFLAACVRIGFNVYDVKPELQDVSITQRVRRINAQNLTLLVTYGYNAYGDGTSFNGINGYQTFYSPTNRYAAASRVLARNVSDGLAQTLTGRNLGFSALENVGVLSSVNCKSILAEAGFMTNFREAKLMQDPDFARDVAEGTCIGVCANLNVRYVPELSVSSLPTLRNGSRGRYVRYLQWLLRIEGDTVTPDGIFGPATETAVRNFQTRNGLSVDGIVGRNTWTALTGAGQTLPILRRGSRGRYVRYLQQKLLSKLYPVGEADGIFGPATERAVKDFQSENGLTVDGIVGANTWRALTPIGGGRPLP